MRKYVILLFSICFVVISCQETELNDSKLEAIDFSFHCIENITEEELFSFFGVDDYSTLKLQRLRTEDKKFENYYVIIESEYSDNVVQAPKLAYVFANEENGLMINHFFQRTPSVNKNNNSETIQIFADLDKEPDFIINYDLQNQNFELVTSEHIDNKSNKNQSEGCFKSCIEDELERISKSNWVRQARFLISAPVEFAWIMAECGVECLS